MATTVSEMTVEDLRRTIKEIVQEVLNEESELTPDFAIELETRVKSNDYISHAEVWSNK